MFEYPDNIDYNFTLITPLQGSGYITTNEYVAVNIPVSDSEED